MDRHAAAQLFADYGWGNDDRDTSLIGACFTQDGTFTIEIAGADEPVGPFEGRDKIVGFISGALAEQRDQRRHVITNLREVDGGMTAILSLFVTEDGQLTVQATGLYNVTFAEEGGRLRFSSMLLRMDRGW